MQKYKYKDSGIEWYGDVPDHWKYDKLFRICRKMGSGGTPTSTNESYYDGDIPWIQSGDLTDSYVFETEKKITEEALASSSAKMFPKGTLLVAMYGATIGKLGIMKMDAATNQACCALQLSGKIESKYMYYLMLDMRDYLITQAYGGGQPNISQEVLKQRHLFYPPPSEQKAIADYLNLACAKIDRIIAIKEEQLEKIEGYFFSRLDEILTCKINLDPDNQSFAGFIDRQIPTEWKIDRLRDLVIINDNALSNNTDPDFLLKYIDIGNVNKYGIVNIESIEELSFDLAPSRARRVTCKYDTIISSVRTNLQAVAYIDMDIENLISSTGFFVCRPRFAEILKPKFLYYFLLTAYSKDYFFSNSTGVSYPAINDYRFGSIYIFVPPTDVQDKIIKRLDKLKTKVSETASTIKSQIEQLKAYRKSLIHECVTGKKQVAEPT